MLRVSHLLRRFVSDDEGVALVLVAIMLPVIIGFAVLAIDMSRVNNLHNDLQKAVDALALAGATELDGNADAETRAENAITNLIENCTKFSTSSANSCPTAGGYQLARADVIVQYLYGIPASDSIQLLADGTDANGKDWKATTAAEAQYAEVTLNPDSATAAFSTIFPASFVGGPDSFKVSTQAVAGNAGQVTCAMTPLFICDPFKNVDGSGPGFDEAVATNLWIGRSVTLETKGAAWGPGNFGFLRPSSNQGYGDTDLSKDLARGTVQECVNSRHLYTSTGNLTTNDIQGLNTRFDMFPANGNSFPSKSNASWPAAPNVRKGYMPGNKGICEAVPGTPDTSYFGLPADNASDPTITDGLVGNGQWAYSKYLTTNNLTNTVGALFPGATDTNPPSRFEVYKSEYTSGAYTQKSGPGKNLENGVPQCSSNVSTDLDRRLIYGAIVDCSDPDNIASLNGASGTNLKAEGFGSFFMLSPVVTSIQTEAVDVSGRAGQGTMANFVRNEVQLYR
ncbi:MAG: TadE/TadG family type IV pilus assembly protein [Rhizobiaceae bacterium]